MNLSVTLVGAAMMTLGLVLCWVTVALWRSAAVDPEVLAPLEVMADRKFGRAEQEGRIDLLNSVRPAGAEVPVSEHVVSPLVREPLREPVRPFRDPFPHDDDAVDVLPVAPPIIDPLLRNNDTEMDGH